MGPSRPSRLAWILLPIAVVAPPARPAGAASAEVKVDRDFLAAVVEKLPPRPFHSEGRYRGTAHDYRLVAIDPAGRRLMVACQVDGEFRPLLAGPLAERGAPPDRAPPGWRKFRFDIKAAFSVEPGADGAPRIRVRVDEVKRRELDGLAGTLATVLGGYFDELATRAADGKAAMLGDKLDAELRKKVAAFQKFGAFVAIDYAPDHVALRFELERPAPTRGAGYLFPTPRPGTVPLYRIIAPRSATRLSTTRPGLPGRPLDRREAIVGYAFDRPQPGTVPLYRWQGRGDDFYTTSPDGEGAARWGYRREGVACHVYPAPIPGAAALDRSFDPRRKVHSYALRPPFAPAR